MQPFVALASHRGDFLYIKVSDFAYTDAHGAVTASLVREALRADPAGALIIDARGVTGDVSVLQRAKFVLHMARARLGVPAAMVLSPGVIDPQRFGMHLARHLRLDMVVFTEYDDAVAWLTHRGIVTDGPPN